MALAAGNGIAHAVGTGTQADAGDSAFLASDADPAAANAAKEAGNAAFKAGDKAGAVAAYRQAVKLDPSNYIYQTNLSLALASLGDWMGSEDAARRSVELAKNVLKGWYRLAKAQSELKKHAEVLETVRQAEKLCTEDSGSALKELRRLRAVSEQALIATATAGTDGHGVAGPGAANSGKSNSAVDVDATPAAAPSTEGAAETVAGAVESESGEGLFLGAKPSIRDFRSLEELGVGNFSTILMVEHRRTGRRFALKVIEKAEASRMRRRHPNIYNEIYMEKRALTRLQGHPGIATLMATFQDYSSLYYLLELCEGGEVWKRLVEGGSKAVGTHPSLARFWLAELVSALEWMHSKGLVHRDVKPENLMLTGGGHLKVVDFGTCKDLLETDLNGPEFVGTAQYMTPQAVASQAQGPEADLWALGCCVYQFLSGLTPFHAPSPYLCFLRIKRGARVVRRPEVLDGDAADLVWRLLRRDPAERLGTEATGGYAALRSHPFFGPHAGDPTLYARPAVRIPFLKELCIRAVAKHLDDYAASVIVVKAPLPPHADVFRMSAKDRAATAHYLWRLGRLREPKVNRLLYRSAVDAKSLRADVVTREYLGLDWDTQGQWSDSFFFVHITDPLLGLAAATAAAAGGAATGGDGGGDGGCEVEAECLRQAVAVVNRLRPRFVVVTGNLTRARPGEPHYAAQVEEARSILARVSETVPVLYCPGDHDMGIPAATGAAATTTSTGTAAALSANGHEPTEAAAVTTSYTAETNAGAAVTANSSADGVWRRADPPEDDAFVGEFVRKFGADFYGFWWGGVRGLVVNSAMLATPNLAPARAAEQLVWLHSELELAQLNAHHVLVFCHHPLFVGDPREESQPDAAPLPTAVRLRLLARLGRCRVRAVFSGHCRRNADARVGRIKVPKASSAANGAPGSARAAEDDVEELGRLSPAAGREARRQEQRLCARDHVDSGSGSESSDDEDKEEQKEERRSSRESNASGGDRKGRRKSGGGTSGEGGSKEAGSSGDEGGQAGADSGSESSDDEGEGGATGWVEEKVDMEMVVTASVAAPLGRGADPPGLRVVCVTRDRIEHTFYPLDQVPIEVILQGDESAGGRHSN